MSIAASERPAEAKPPVSHHDSLTRSKTTPLYVVCSPRRGVGKTLLSRLLIEFHDLDDRPVAAFDLAEEGPQLADFMPDRTTIADINDISGQMAFFDSLIPDSNAIKVIDLGHRIFRNFFIIVQKIGFFEEARRHGIEPLLLFMVDPDPKSAEAYSTLQRRFKNVPLLPVRNHAITKGMPYRDAFPNGGAVPVSPEIPVLGPSLKALVEQQSFSFAQFWRKALERFPARLDNELRPWMERVFFQFRQIDICLTREDILGESKTADIPRTVRSDQDRPKIRKPPKRSPPPALVLDDDGGTEISALLWTGCNRASAVTSERRQSTLSGPKFAPENGDPADATFVAKLQQAASLSNENCNRATALAHMLSAELRDAQQRINQLERQAAELLDRARAEAETALALLQAKADAHLEQTKREAEDRVGREVAEAENRVARLQDELAQAKAKSERLSTETTARIERIKKLADNHAREKVEAESHLARLQDELAQAKESAKQMSADAAVHIERIAREADERVTRLQATAENRIAKLQSDLTQARRRGEQSSAEAVARIERIKNEADERVARAEADTDERLARARAEIEGTFTRLLAELALARQRADRAKAEADAQIEHVRRAAEERVRSVEADEERRLERVRAATEQVSRLEAELAEAKRRAERAEHWLSRIREEIEGHLIPSFAAVRNWQNERS